MTSPVPDYSDSRRTLILDYLRLDDMVHKLPAETLLVYVVLALVMADDGSSTAGELTLALADPSIVQAANVLIEKARDGN